MASSTEKLLHFYGLDESNAQWIYDYFTEIEQNGDISTLPSSPLVFLMMI